MNDNEEALTPLSDPSTDKQQEQAPYNEQELITDSTTDEYSAHQENGMSHPETLPKIDSSAADKPILQKPDPRIISDADRVKYALLELRKKLIITSADLNDKTLGRIFAQSYKDLLRYVPEWKSYVYYDGKVWRRDHEGQYTKLLCKQFIDALYTILPIVSPGDKEKYLKQLILYQRENRRRHLYEDAKSELNISASSFDRRIELFNVLNGTIDLETGELLTHSSDHMLTKIAPVDYYPQAISGDWNDVLMRSQDGDAGTIRYLQKVFGKALLGDVSDEKLFILGFEERSGKGVITGTIERVLGVDETGYACNAQGNVFELPYRTNPSGARSNIAMMKNKRLIVVHEPPKGMKLDSALVKQITGGDMVTARKNYENDSTFTPIGTVVMASNHMPLIDDKTVVTSGRIVVIPFDQRVPEAERDTGLKNRLASPMSLSAVLNWLLEGARLYRDEGLGSSPRIQEQTLSYIEHSDYVRRFIKERLIADAESRIKGKELFSEYTIWLRLNGDLEPGSPKEFYKELELNGINIKDRAVIEGVQHRNVIIGAALAPPPQA